MLSNILLYLIGIAQADNGKFTYVEMSEVCPFKGTLLDDDAMAHLLTLPDYEQEMCNLQIEKEKDLVQSKCNLKEKELQAEIEFHKSEVERVTVEKDTVIDTQKAELEKCKKNDNPIVFTIGVAVGIGVTYLLVRALGGV